MEEAKREQSLLKFNGKNLMDKIEQSLANVGCERKEQFEVSNFEKANLAVNLLMSLCKYKHVEEGEFFVSFKAGKVTIGYLKVAEGKLLIANQSPSSKLSWTICYDLIFYILYHESMARVRRRVRHIGMTFVARAGAGTRGAEAHSIVEALLKAGFDWCSYRLGSKPRPQSKAREFLGEKPVSSTS
ncbi:hypothetical protein Syun_027562 [Stephania yunnanensis]|uniref:Uncharacterized protein n=1 Tax=Stephania yunnanensis TaxID=152371 RepID=A0AAP0EFW2_9MAGN